MKPISNLAATIGTLCIAIGACSQAFAEAKPNPYLGIVERNPFGLKEPPPPPPVKAEEPVVPPAKVILTGITSLFGPPRAFLEITEQEPGKPAIVKRPILHEGERDGAVEIISIDPAKYVIHIRNSGQELDVKFEDPSKLASAAPRPASAPPPSPLPMNVPTAMSAPTIISPAAAENSSRASSVSMFSGESGMAQNSNAGQTPAYNNMAMNPSQIRDLRTPATPQQPVDSAVQYLGMLAHEEKARNENRAFPPVPPVPGSRAAAGQGNQGAQNFPPVPGQ